MNEKPITHKRIIITVKGKVQGVCFRHYTQKKATELGVFGYVKNQSDGSVTIVAEGLNDSIQKLLNWASNGPSHSRVDSIEHNEQIYQDEFEGFNIRY